MIFEPVSGSARDGPAGAESVHANWTPLRYFNLYRATLSGLIITLGFFGIAPRYFGQADSELFWITAIAYFLFSFVCALAIQMRWMGFQLQVVLQITGDIACITLMMHASGGVASGFGMLLVVAIAGASLLTEGRIAVLFAALASLAVLSQQIYAWLYQSFPATSYSQAGMLGITFFATAYLAHALAKRVRASEALALKRGIDAANLAQLNEHIIQRMQSGVLVLDEQACIRFMNESAKQLLGFSGDASGKHLRTIAPELTGLDSIWRHDTQPAPRLFLPSKGPAEVLASFAQLGQGGAHGALVYLEDASATRQRAQQLKLASLGRLTASIAHEIRNPLGAISHAGQLLEEAPALPRSDRRLTQIIQENCTRMNAIVENILQLSRRKEAVRERIDLRGWLEQFTTELRSVKGLRAGQIALLLGEAALDVRIDPSQLHQVLWNLCENGIRHAGAEPRLTIRADVSAYSGRTYLEVMDNGPGIAEDIADNLFEPFFTTQPDGTGLGLYIARELCEINQASLSLRSTGSPGGCFRITFSDLRRQDLPST